LHLDAEACVIGDGGPEEGDGAALFLVLHDLAEGDARGIVDADVNELPTQAFAAASPAALASTVARDPVADAVDSAELFDIDVDEFTRVFAFVAAHRLGRFQSAQLVQVQALQNATDGRRRDPCLGRDRLAGQPLAPKGFDPLDHRLRRRSIQPSGPRAAVRQAGKSFSLVAFHPFAHRPRADAYGFADSLRRLPARHLAHDPLSTMRRETGILVNVHPVSPRDH